MTDKDIKLLEYNGWTVACESPFELEMWDEFYPDQCLGTATGEAADFILRTLRAEEDGD